MSREINLYTLLYISMFDQINYDFEPQSIIHDRYSINVTIKKFLHDLYKETMFKGKDMSDNVTIYFDPSCGHLYVEYIGYRGTDCQYEYDSIDRL